MMKTNGHAVACWCLKCRDGHIPPSPSQHKNKNKRIAELKDKIEDRDKILKKANIFVNDVMPQIGGLTIQDFANLNELCMGLTNLGYESK